MFTGIIQFIGKVVLIREMKGGRILKISVPKIKNNDLKLGDSVAINGVCLTISQLLHNEFEVYVGARTLSCTSLSKITPGKKVNVEYALKMGDKIGGHLVQGHIDGVGKIINRISKEGNIILSISPPTECMKYLVPNGSIAIDGVSLTIADIRKKSFEVALVPYTLDNTTLRDLKVGDIVNIEVDILGKYLVR
jgi:riboflavin synthase